MFLLRLFLALGITYALYAGVMYGEQRTLLFPYANEEHHAYRGLLPHDATLATMPTSFGEARAVFLPAPRSDASAPAVIFTHGNAEIVDDMTTSMQALRAQGFHVMLLEYPGYSGADGMPTRESIDEASAAAFDWLAARKDVDAQRIIAMGVSVGGAPAAELTQKRPVRALVLLSTFTAVREFAAGYGLPGWLVRDDFNSEQRVREFAGPVLVAHGRRDEIIPFAQGQALAAAARQGQFQAFDCGHNDCPYRSEGFALALRKFLVDSNVMSAAPAVAKR
jgi:pimeloyl-ACP methyl ester carboxylesterase